MPARDVLNLPGYDAPIAPYAPSPYYASAQGELSKLGTGLLKGDIPDYYKSIGEIGGQTFEQMIGGVRTDIERGVTAQAARLGQRGGAPLEVAGREMARVTPALRWQEMMRGVQGRESLLGLGTQLTARVGQMGLAEAGQRGTYQMNLAQMGLSERQFQDKLALNKEQFTASLTEQKRQFTEELEFRRERGEITDAQFQQEMELKNRQLNVQAQMWADQKEAQESATSGGLWGDIIGGLLGAAGTAYGGYLSRPETPAT